MTDLPRQPYVTARLEAAYAHFRDSRLDEAAALLREVIEADPDCGEALEGLAYIAGRQGDAKAAAGYFERALACLPATAARWHDAGLANQAAGRHGRALACFDEALALSSRAIATLHAAALSASEIDDHERAARLLATVRDLEPRAWQSHYNLGRALGLAGRYDEEISAYRRAIELDPNAVMAYINLGVALRDLHRFDEAMRVFKKAVQLDPEHPGARTNRAQTNLLLGQFEHGWREYEWRWKDGEQLLPPWPNPWRGESPIAGKTLLVFNEQGFGDTLQFVRYVDALTARGAQVILRVQDALLGLLSDYPGAATVIGESEPLPPFDLHCPLLSLPFALGAHRSPVPANVPYLRADSTKRSQWRERLAASTQGLHIGIAWSGNTGNLAGRHRSTSLEAWQPLVNALATRASFVSLVKDVRPEDIPVLRNAPVLNVAEELETFADTAALIAELDLVISIDTAVAHLAGALAKPVWVLLPYTPDWRWGLARADSPWYPSARLIRQPARDDWTSVMNTVLDELNAFAARGVTASTRP